MLIARVIKL